MFSKIFLTASLLLSGVSFASTLSQSDAEISASSGLTLEELTYLRRYLRETRSTPIIRFVMNEDERQQRNQEIQNRPDYFSEIRSFTVYVGPEQQGKEALEIPGAIVWHRRAMQKSILIGEFNPALMNMKIARAMENKNFEFRLVNENAPNVMPQTLLLSELFAANASPEQVQKALNEKFPNGWVMKGVWDYATGRRLLVTDQVSLKDSVQAYRAGDFEQYRAHLESLKGSLDLDDFIEKTQKHRDYQGSRIARFLEAPQNALIQERLRIETEYRVEAVLGEVIGNGSTVDRHAWTAGLQNPGDVDPVKLRRVENFAKEILNALPEQLRLMPFAFDIAILKDGSLRLIETNPGGNSGYFVFYEKSVAALEKFLLEAHARGLLSKEKLAWATSVQSYWIDSKRAKWEIDGPTKVSSVSDCAGLFQ